MILIILKNKITKIDLFERNIKVLEVAADKSYNDRDKWISLSDWKSLEHHQILAITSQLMRRQMGSILPFLSFSDTEIACSE